MLPGPLPTVPSAPLPYVETMIQTTTPSTPLVLRARQLLLSSTLSGLALLTVACGPSNGDQSQAVDSGDQSVELDNATATEGELTSATDAEAVAFAAEPTETTSAPAEPTATPEAPALTGGQIAPPGQISNWEGVIDNDIPVKIWLAQNDTFLRGEISYGAEPIMLLGRQYPNGGYFLHEFGPDGNVSGTLIMPTVNNGNVIDATWGDLPLRLDFSSIGDTPFFFDPLVRPGNYVYAFGPFGGDEVCCGPIGLMQISNVTETELTVSFNNTTSGPAFNRALISTTTIPLDQNVARFERTDSFHPNCKFEISIFDGYAYVQHVDEAFDCGFGNAAGVEAIYVLDENAGAASTEPLGDETLTASSFGEIELGQSWRSLTQKYGVPAFDPTVHQLEECYYVQLPDVPNSPWLMLIGDKDDAIVSRIEPTHDDHRSDAKVGVGSTEAAVLAAHDNNIAEAPHVYLGEGAKYLTVNVEPGISSTLLYETNEQGIVVSVRNGYLGPVAWVEGCV